MPVQQAFPTPQPGTAGTAWHLAKKIGNPAKKKKKIDNKEDSLPRPRLLFPGEQGADSGRFKGRRFGQTSLALCGTGSAESRVCSAWPGWASAATGTHPSTTGLGSGMEGTQATEQSTAQAS